MDGLGSGEEWCGTTGDRSPFNWDDSCPLLAIPWINYLVWLVFLGLQDEMRLYINSENSHLFALWWRLLCPSCKCFPSQSGHVYLPEKISFSAGFSAFQRSNYCFRSCCCGLSDIFMSLADTCSALVVLGGADRNRHCLNFQGYWGCADLLSQVLTEWVFLLLPNIPEQGGNEMMGIYQSRWKWLFTCWKGGKSLG